MERSVGAVGVLDKIVRILDEVAADPSGLAELSRRTGLPKPTLHRLCSALEAHGVLERDGEVRRIGSTVARWSAGAGLMEERLRSASGSALARLRDETQESVQLYVRDGESRRCIAALESPHGLRTIVDVGAVLPLGRGSAGEALTVGAGREWFESVEAREPGVASVSAPVLVGGAVVAAVSVSGPVERTTRRPGRRYGGPVAEAARAIAEAVGRA